jgi:hypothetical protein
MTPIGSLVYIIYHCRNGTRSQPFFVVVTQKHRSVESMTPIGSMVYFIYHFVMVTHSHCCNNNSKTQRPDAYPLDL